METFEKEIETSEIAASNKELIKRFYQEVYVEWKMELADQVLSPQFTSHDWPNGGSTGPQAFRDYYATLRSAIPDARYEVDDIIAENDKVVVRWRLLGTHKGRYQGITPTGRAVTLKGIAIYRIDSSQLIERWVVSDLYGLLEEIRGFSAQ